MKKTLSILFLAVIAGCANNSPNLDSKSVEYGEYPKNFSEIVKSHYYSSSKYPDSIRFNVIHIPRYASIPDGLLQARSGYIVCADLNLKNNRGEYTGHHTDGLLIKNGQVIHFMENGQWLGKNVC